MALGRGDANTANAKKTLPNRIIVTGPAYMETLIMMGKAKVIEHSQDHIDNAGHAPRESVTELPPFDNWQRKSRKRRKPSPTFPKHCW